MGLRMSLQQKLGHLKSPVVENDIRPALSEPGALATGMVRPCLRNPSLTLRALTNSLRALNVNHYLQIIGIHPDVDDAASDDDVHAQSPGSSTLVDGTLRKPCWS